MICLYGLICSKTYMKIVTVCLGPCPCSFPYNVCDSNNDMIDLMNTFLFLAQVHWAIADRFKRICINALKSGVLSISEKKT